MESSSNHTRIDTRLFTFIVCTLGGLLVGLLVKSLAITTVFLLKSFSNLARLGVLIIATLPGLY